MTHSLRLMALSGSLTMMALMQPAFAARDTVPHFDVSSSCKAAEAYDFQEDKTKTFQGCLQDENRAHDLIVKNWSSYKIKDRGDCVQQSQLVAPSYVEMLTCLEMSDETGALLSKDVNQPTGQERTTPRIQTDPTMPPK